MEPPNQRQPANRSERRSRIEALVDEARNHSTAGDAVLLQTYPELMPELAAMLRDMREVQASASQAHGTKEILQNAFETAWQDDMAFLKAELPNYDILERVQYGGQGVVYRAVQRATNRNVAIKVLLDGPLATERQRRRFAREVELCSRLNHPNVVTIYDSGVVHGRNYCAMQFVEGLPIDVYVQLHGLAVRQVVRLFITVCRAVSYAHQRGILHRDLSPANILIDPAGAPHVLDFGLAKDLWQDNREPHSQVSRAGEVVGTVPYMSPEQVGGQDGQVDVRSDIYTLGVVLYRLLTGALPYAERSRSGLQVQILDADPLPMRRRARQVNPHGQWRELPRDLEMITAKALVKNKEQRYQSAAALAEDLERFLAGEAVAARSGHTLYVLRKAVRRHRVAFGAAAAVLLTLGVSAVVATGLWLEARTQREEARAQRDKARQGFRVAHSIFDKVVTDIDESIRPLAGGTEVSDRLLNVVADELPALEALAASDQSLTDVVARLHERQGDICKARRANEQAAAHYQTCLKMALEQAKAAPGELEHMHDAARAHFNLAKVTQDPREHYEQAIQIEQKLLAGRAAASEFAAVLAEARTEFSRYLWGRNEFGPALEQAEAALSLVRGQAALLESDEGQMLLALACERYSDAAIKMGQGDGGLETLRECVRIRERLSAARPVDVNRRYMLLRAYMRLGVLMIAAPDSAAGGREVLEKGARIGEYLLSVDSTNAGWRWDTWFIYDTLGLASRKSKDLTAADAYCEKEMSLLRDVPAGQEQDRGLIKLRGDAYANCAGLRIEQRRFEEAEVATEQAIAIREGRHAADPDDSSAEYDLAGAYDLMGRICWKQRRMVDSWLWYEKAYDINERLFQARPDEAERELQYLFAKSKFAVWHMVPETPEGDAAGAAILDEVAADFARLEQRGALKGQMAGSVRKMIEDNRRELASRAAKRAASQPCDDNDDPDRAVP